MYTTTEARRGNAGLWKLAYLAIVLLLGAAFLLWAWRAAAGAHAALELQRAGEMTSESRALCEKWGVAAGTPAFAECLADIQTVRDRHKQRLIEDYEF